MDTRHFPTHESGNRKPDDIDALRRLIISEVVKHLVSEYHVDPSQVAAADPVSSPVGIDALFSFRTDLRLDNLRGALARLEAGTFGYCIGCKEVIDWDVLHNDITARICPGCEDEFNHYRLGQIVGHQKT